MKKSDLPLWVPADAWRGYEEMRRKIKKPMTDYARKLALNRLEELMSQGHSATAVLEQSIFNSWQGLFAPKGDPNSRPYNAHAHVGEAPRGTFRPEYVERLKREGRWKD